MKWIILLVAAATMSCAQPPYVAVNQFNPTDAEYINEAGENKINGQAFLRQKGGGIVTCAGATVTLVPTTSYARERIQHSYGTTAVAALSRPGVQLAQPPRYYLEYTKTTVCDAQGNFEFFDVADGDYFVVTAVRWTIPARYISLEQGGGVMSPISVQNGQAVNLIIAP